MLFKTHLAFGFLCSLIFAKLYPVENLTLFLLVACAASIFPDIDNRDAAMGKRHKIMTRLFEHRGFMHTIFPPLIFSGIVWYLGFQLIALAIFIGYMSHLLIDSITKAGINFLHPLSTFRISGFIKTGGFLELILFLVLLGVNIFFLLTNKSMLF